MRQDNLILNRPEKIIRRSGDAADFNPDKIKIAVLKAFNAVHGDSLSHELSAQRISEQVVSTIISRQDASGTPVVHIENVQDKVEVCLMRSGHTDVARAYILYRERRAKDRLAARGSGDVADVGDGDIEIGYIAKNGDVMPLRKDYLRGVIDFVSKGLGAVDADALFPLAARSLFHGISWDDVIRVVCYAAASRIELHPQYSTAAARALRLILADEVSGAQLEGGKLTIDYPNALKSALVAGAEHGLVAPEMLSVFNLSRLGDALIPENDDMFGYLGLQTLYDRYFLHIDGRRIELPQVFFMRVAMGLALNEDEPDQRAVEFYNLLSNFKFLSSTPTLFNAGTTRPQMSSCYLTTVEDSIDGIFRAHRDNAMLAKFAGGLGNDWSRIRSLGARIKGTNGASQGVIPFLRIVNDTAVAVNQGGKRRGAICAYLETWHMDIADFLDLRKNTGDERRRTHDMNTANWIPDLFLKRVLANADWTLFSPSDTPDLHELYGSAFERRYHMYESAAAAGEIPHRTVSAVDLWRHMLTMLFETGHPWITFKDPCNIRSPQRHRGVVHSSNLCTEITLNTSDDEIAVCNLGSVNLHAHMRGHALQRDALEKTVSTAMRMLDNVVDLNLYPIDKARKSNLEHRPVGLGMMGFQDCLYEMGISYNSENAVRFADESAEIFCHAAYTASCHLAEERGVYPSYKGSLWDQGVLPLDSCRLLASERAGVTAAAATLFNDNNPIDSEFLKIDMSQQMDWEPLRRRIREHGMRNSNCVAIAPTATIANIAGVTPSIEPAYQNIYAKSNLSGDFTVSNPHLVEALSSARLWSQSLLESLKFHDGDLQKIAKIPDEIKKRFATAFDIPPEILIRCAARRQKWIDQAQSLNLYATSTSGKALHEMYLLAWLSGLKTTYYLRSRGASSTEKYTAPAGAHNAVPADAAAASCDPLDGACEACQ